MSASVGCMVAIASGVVTDISGDIGVRPRTELPDSDLVCHISSERQGPPGRSLGFRGSRGECRARKLVEQRGSSKRAWLLSASSRSRKCCQHTAPTPPASSKSQKGLEDVDKAESVMRGTLLLLCASSQRRHFRAAHVQPTRWKRDEWLLRVSAMESQ